MQALSRNSRSLRRSARSHIRCRQCSPTNRSNVAFNVVIWLSFLSIMFLQSTIYLCRIVAFEVRERNPYFVLGVLCIIWGPVQLIREVFSTLHLCRDRFASPWGDCLCFASLWRANSYGDSCVLGVYLSNLCWGLLFVFVKRTYFKSLLKVYYRSVFVESSKALNTLSNINVREIFCQGRR